MPAHAFSSEVQTVLDGFLKPGTKTVLVDGKSHSVPSPFPSPTDWRDCWIYFAMVDRFNNPAKAPAAAWNRKFGSRQGGTFEGVRTQLAYLQDLGVKAIWLSPVLRNSPPRDFEFTYPGYNAQDFFTLDARFASDGTEAAAERELKALVDEAHARGIYVVVDIVLNHTGRVFDYVRNGKTVDSFTDSGLLYGPPGREASIEWINGFGQPRSDWRDKVEPAGAKADDAVFPLELQRPAFFRRRGTKVSDTPAAPLNYVPGDFGVMRQLVVEYDATVPGQEEVRARKFYFFGVFAAFGGLSERSLSVARLRRAR